MRRQRGPDRVSGGGGGGRDRGQDAVSDARPFGLAPGSPIYYDMEAYSGGQSCMKAVLTFLGAWDRAVAAAGYLTGVYSSQDSGIVNMQAADRRRQSGVHPAGRDLGRALGQRPSLNDGYLAWPLSERSKQYCGQRQRDRRRDHARTSTRTSWAARWRADPRVTGVRCP